ncbi:hypothetical protein [Enterococcus avium]|uniref:hypothetical protein n=1 Tax=Enterococcus avium TaxID=33945 RepID=UPI002E135A8F
MKITDKARFRMLMAHPNYWYEEDIKREAEKLGKKICREMQKNPNKKIDVSINNRIGMGGTEDELGQRSTLSPVTIRNLARNNGTDRFGKSYR